MKQFVKQLFFWTWPIRKALWALSRTQIWSTRLLSRLSCRNSYPHMHFESTTTHSNSCVWVRDTRRFWARWIRKNVKKSSNPLFKRGLKKSSIGQWFYRMMLLLLLSVLCVSKLRKLLFYYCLLLSDLSGFNVCDHF